MSSRRISARFNRNRIHSGKVTIPPSWTFVTGAFAGWRADLGMAYSAGGSMTWTDQIGSSTLTQGTGANVPTFSSADGNWGGKPSVTFDGTNDFITSSLGAASWSFLHDGTGATVLMVFRPASTSPATGRAFFTGAAAAKGVVMNFDRANSRMTFNVSDGVTNVIAISPAVSSIVADTNNAVVVTHLTTTTPDATLYYNGSTTSRGTGSGVVAAGAPSATLSVGASAGASTPVGMSLVELVFWARELSAAERTAISSYLSNWYGFP